MMHFVRFKDEAYLRAIKVFGRPDFIHRHWDARAVRKCINKATSRGRGYLSLDLKTGLGADVNLHRQL
jgi:hypothetical protein